MVSSEPGIAVAILNWNGKSYLETFLPSIFTTVYSNFKVYVIDNASTDDSVDWLKIHYPQVNIIVLDKNYGYAGGYNKGLQQIKADYFMLLNSDVAVAPDWLKNLVALMLSDSSIAACQPKILAYNDKKRFEYAGASGGWIDKYGYPFSRGRVFDTCEVDTHQYDDAVPVFWASGACLFIKAHVFHEAKGFDNYFFAHQEEVDLCWRIQMLGYKIFVCPSAIVYHVGGGTLPQGNSLKTYLNFRNNLIMLHKNLLGFSKYRIIFIRLLLDGIAGTRNLLKGDIGYFFAIIKAHFGFYKWILSNKKVSVLPVKKIKITIGVLENSVIWAYFISGKKKFSEIVHKQVTN